MIPATPAERSRAIRLSSVAIGFLVLVVVWRYTPLSEWLSVERVAPALEALSESAWRGPIVLSVFVLANLVVFPVTVLIAATAIAFGASSGFVWALAGSLLSSVVTFGVGRRFGRPLLESVAGERIHAVAGRLARGGLVSVLVMRNVPIAPFTVVNFAAGASPIRFSDYLLGTILGMTPGVAALIFLGDRLRDLWQHPTAANLTFLAVAVSVWIALALGLQRLSNRLARARSAGAAPADPMIDR